ncbi:MAG: hypothetical protein V2A79_06355, partial [Planctomycetota bacterium]
MTAYLPVLALTLLLPAANHDNNVEWSGVSHHSTYDRDPMCPVDGESFTVSFQTWDYDITSARVRVWTGTETWITAAY